MKPGTLRPLPPRSFDYRQAQHLLNRAGFGGTPAQVRGLAGLGVEGAVEHVVDFHDAGALAAASGGFDRDIMRPPEEAQRKNLRRARMAGDEETLSALRRMRQEAQQADRRQMAGIQRWWLARMIETPRPLEEKMTLFWHGHFATNYRAIEDSYHMFAQNQLFRAHATGNFKGLSHAIIRDPAMLRYLNNDQNRREQPNENLARELMELFTLGEGQVYGEDDIKEGARALTGFTFHDDEFVGPGSRQYQRLHDPGRKSILGRAGNWNGDDFVEIIFSQRACSDFICWKLYRYFVNDLPGGLDETSRRCIAEMSRLLRESDYDLRPVLRALFRSEHFYDPANVGAQVKSPVQLVVQSLRTLNVPPRELEALLAALRLMGQDLFYPPSVKGWEGGRSWINTSTLFVRQNTLVYQLTGRRPQEMPWEDDAAAFDAASLVEHLRRPDGSADPREAADWLLRINLAVEPPPGRAEALAEFAGARKLDNAMVIAMLCLITAMPEYQLC